MATGEVIQRCEVRIVAVRRGHVTLALYQHGRQVGPEKTYRAGDVMPVQLRTVLQDGGER